MTLLRTVLVLLLLIAAVVLVAGCTAGPEENRRETTTPAITMLPIVTTEIPAPEAPREPFRCSLEEKVPYSVISGEPFSVRSQIPNPDTSKIRIWLFGSKTAMMFGPHTDPHDKGNLTISGEVTARLKNGTYQIIFQYPDNAGQFDVAMKNPGYPDWILNEKGDLILDTEVVRKGGMPGVDAANLLEKAIGSAGNDRKYERITLNVTEAWIRIDPVGNHTIGDIFTITGTTNLAAGEEVFFIITPLDYRPSAFAQEWASTHFIPASDRVRAGSCGINSWSFDIDSKTFLQKEYEVTIGAVMTQTSDSERFFMAAATAPGVTSRGNETAEISVTAP